MMVETIRYTTLSTPLIPLLVAASRRGVCAVRFNVRGVPDHWVRDDVALERIREKLQRYFLGQSVSFDELLDYGPATSFQRNVWEQLRSIPFGETRTYGEVARRIGNPGAARAVGSACGANPIAIIVPCHRVISAGGGLGGFSAGLPLKKALLSLESD